MGCNRLGRFTQISFTASGLVPMSNWETSIHSRLKDLIFPDEPVILTGDSESDDGKIVKWRVQVLCRILSLIMVGTRSLECQI